MDWSICVMEEPEPEPEQEQKHEVWSWGAGTDGQLATGRQEDEWLPQLVESLSSLQISTIACGGAHALALLRGGKVVSWGRGKSGQLGHGDCESIMQPKLVGSLENISISSMAAGWSHSAFVSEDGEVYMWGGTYHGKLGIKKEDTIKINSTLLGQDGDWLALQRIGSLEGIKTRQIAAGAEHSAMVLENEAVMTWGWGEHGQLGLGSTGDQQCPQIVPIHVRPSTKLNKSVVYCGSGFTFTLRYLT